MEVPKKKRSQLCVTNKLLQLKYLSNKDVNAIKIKYVSPVMLKDTLWSELCQKYFTFNSLFCIILFLKFNLGQ